MMVDVGLRATSETLVGREDEMSSLRRAMDSALVDGSAVVLVAGEAGVGKSRLIQELVAEAAARRFRIGVGHCVDFGETIWPLAPLRELVAGLMDQLDEEALDLVLGPARVALARLVTAPGGATLDETPLSSDRLCELVIGMFVRLTDRGPLLFVVEDLHWADPTTRTLFAALVRVPRIGPLLLVGTYRSDELHRRHPLRPTLAEVERLAHCARLSLEPLDRWETALLIDALDPSASDGAYVELVHRRSGGNPFYVEELVAARRTGIATIPDTLRDVVVARAAALDDRDVAVLGVAAAAGETSEDVLADVTGIGRDELDSALARLRASAQLARTDSVRFRHELAREVFYDELLPGERTRIHARLAASLEALCSDHLGEIARHWSAAQNSRRALPALVAAGRHALGTGAAAEAEAHLARALDLWDGVTDAATLCDVDHAGLLVEAAEAAKHAGRLDRAIELSLQAVAELSSVDRLREGCIWLELRDLYRFTRRYADCAEAVDRALALIPTSPPSRARARALANATLNEYWARRAAQALSYARQAVEIAETVGDLDIVVVAYDALCAAHAINGQTEEALEVALANVNRCNPAVPAEIVLAAYNSLIGSLHDLGRFREIPSLARRAIALARDSGLGGPRGSWMAIKLTYALVVLGCWSEADAVRAEHADLFERSSVEGLLGATWGVALMRQGRLAEARPLIAQTRATHAGSDWPEDRAWFIAAVAMYYAAEGRLEDAAALFTDHFRSPHAEMSFGDAYLLSIGMAILVDGTLSHPRPDPAAVARADVLATSWIAHVDASCATWAWLAPQDTLDREHALLQLERLRGCVDPERWAQLADGWHNLGFRYEEAAARLRAAEARLAGSSKRSTSARHEATEQLTRARNIAVELPAPPLVARIEDLARRANLTVETVGAPPSGNFGLTRREQVVLTLLAKGRSNGQIAHELFISTKTASVHVSNILRKLGVANRIEAAEHARLHGIER
jgi:DNA-binding CsgD family transcriptional regulator/tetratricopeptide (TPR) repeat protein